MVGGEEDTTTGTRRSQPGAAAAAATNSSSNNNSSSSSSSKTHRPVRNSRPRIWTSSKPCPWRTAHPKSSNTNSNTMEVTITTTGGARRRTAARRQAATETARRRPAPQSPPTTPLRPRNTGPTTGIHTPRAAVPSASHRERTPP